MIRGPDVTPLEPSESTRAEAAAWIAKLHGPDRSAEIEAGLRRWLSEDAAHARAFERMTDAWEDATLAASGAPLPRVRGREQVHRNRAWAIAAAILVLGVLGIWLSWLLRHEVYSTGVGEQRIVRLEDGSRVSLNSASRLVVEYRSSERRLRLTRGEALFEVTPNPRRPFIVSAGTRRVTALGTSFSVRLEPDRFDVFLIEGKVTVAPIESPVPSGQPAPGSALATDGHNRQLSLGKPSDAPSDVVFTLTPGQRLTFTSRDAPRLDMPPADRLTAWRRGEVVLDKTALTDAVAEMNRYDNTHLIIDEAQLGTLQISGVYQTGDNKGFARALEAVHGIRLVPEGDSIHLRANNP
jgi:transmembrane sensor